MNLSVMLAVVGGILLLACSNMAPNTANPVPGKANTSVPTPLPTPVFSPTPLPTPVFSPTPTPAPTAAPIAPRPEPLSQAERVIALINSPTSIDPISGCGHRNYWENNNRFDIGGNGGLQYPDGLYRSFPTGSSRNRARGLSADTMSVQYWNDWLGLSDDYEAALSETNRLWKNGPPSYHGEEQENTEVIFDGYPLLFPEKGAKELEVSSQVEDVGYWDFSESGGNSIAGGFDWSFTSNKEKEDVLFHNGILDVPYIPGDSWGVLGSVELKPRQVVDKSLDREAFTMAFSVLPEGLPNEMPLLPKVLQYASDMPSWREKHSPTRLLFSFGEGYRWLQIYINELCQTEVTLNLSPAGDYSKHHSVYLVSQVELDIKKWNEIQFTIDIPQKRASLTVINGSDFPNKTEIFSLPDDFEWNFQSDWTTTSAFSNLPSVRYVDNNMGIFSGSGSGHFGGKLDWIYLANGIQDPASVESRVVPLRALDAVAREPAKISVSSDGYIASAELSLFDYPEWEAGAFVNSSMRNNVLKDVYSVFKDDFDFIFLVQNEEDTTLDYMGSFRGISNDVVGISEDAESFDTTKYVGSDGKLKGVTHLPLKSGICCGPSLHELMHHWGNFSLSTYTFDENVVLAKDGMDETTAGSHWGVSSVNGQLGGFDLSTLEELGGNWYTADGFGTFANGGNSIPYGNFELYLMGLIPPEEVEDVVLFRGLTATAGDFFDDGKWYAEEKITVTVEDVINKLGSRVPDHNMSQKEFKLLTLVLTDDPLTDEEWTFFSKQAKDFEETFSWATGGRGTIKLGDLYKSKKR